MPEEGSTLVLPSQAGLRDAYYATLRYTLTEGHNDHWLGDLITIISSDCGVNRDTAKNRCKQLARFDLLSFVSSSILGHKYRVMVFKKSGKDVGLVEDWKEFSKIVTDSLKDIAEADLVKVHRMMKRGITERTSRKAVEEAGRVFSDYDTGRVILPDTDTIRSEVKFLNRMTPSEVCARVEKQIANDRRDEGEQTDATH